MSRGCAIVPAAEAGRGAMDPEEVLVRTNTRQIRRGAGLSLVLGLAGVAAAGDDPVPPAPPAVPQVAPAPDAPATAAAASPKAAASPPASDLRAAVEGVVGAPVHGDLTLRYRVRRTTDATDQDFYQYLNLRVGDETKDRVSATVFVRAAEDLDRAHEGETGYVFDSIDDTFESSVNALLYTAYATIRPATGPIESMRLGRQYVYAANTFHFDGASATTQPLVDSVKLKLTAYGGVPVHFYESSPGGDWLGGVRFAAEPWKTARAALDYTHVDDRLSELGTEKNDLVSLSMWQTIAKHYELYGEFSWLDGPREGTARATASFPDQDLTVQASYYRLLEDKQELATEFDPYTAVLNELARYQQGDLRVSKGFGENFDVEIGGVARQLLPGEATGPFNRDTRQFYVTPTLSDLPWKGTSISVTADSYSDDGERLQTWALDVTHKFSKTLKVSAGSDYSLYAFGPLGTDERSHVRTAYARVRKRLSDAVTADIQYTWEKDDVETFHVLTLALVFEF